MLRKSWALFLTGLGCLAFVPAVFRSSSFSSWTSILAVVLFLAAVASAFVLISRIHCPGCGKRLLVRPAPSWYRTPVSGKRDTIRCANCHELVDVSGGNAQPPEAARERAE